jgi:hypothetical protein
MTMGRGGIFGNPPEEIPDPSVGLFGRHAALPKKKPSFFGEGGTGRGIAGFIGDALLQMGGMNPIYQPVMQDKRAMQFAQQQRMMDRRGDMSDWRTKKTWEASNPEPTELERIMIAGGLDPKSPEGQKLLRTAAENKANPPVWRQGPDMQFYRVDTGNRRQIGATVPMPNRTNQSASSEYAPKPDVVKQAYMDLYGPERGAQMYNELIGGR